MNVKEIIKKVYKTNWRLLLTITVMSLFSVAIRTSSTLFLKEVITYIEASNLTLLILWGTLFAVAIIMSFFLTSFNNSRIIKLGNMITESLSSATYKNYIRSEFLEATKFSQDDVIKRILKNSNEIGNKYYSQHIFASLYQSVLLISLTIVLLIINPWFGLITLASFPLYYFITKQITKLVIARKESLNNYNNLLQQTVNDTTNRLKSIKTLNGIIEEENNFLLLSKEYAKANRKSENTKQYDDKNIATLLLSIIMVSIITVGGYLITQGIQSLGVVIASVFLLIEIYSTLRLLLTFLIKPFSIKTEKNEIDELLAMKPENRSDTVQQLDEIYSLKFKDVCFDYGQNTSFNLQDINFELKKGEKLGILGLTGSGKTTLADLLMKLIRPKQGAILINNCDINKVNTYYLRELIAIVPQSHLIIRGTFAQNVTYPLPFDEYKYNDALNRCRLKPLINSLEKKDQTIIDDSINLSASDKQKIAIANALYKDAKIYVFDDSTAKMNQDLEKEIIDEIYKLKNKIIILISNRIHNLTKCDKIIILNNGRIVEAGKTSELLENSKSTFARLVGEQSQIRVVSK